MAAVGALWTLALNRLAGLDLRKYLGGLPVALLALSLPACSSSAKLDENRKPVHPVRGKVVSQGKPAAGAFVLFVPLNEPDEAPDPRPRAEVEGDGSFILSTYGDKDGAPAGEYKVTVTWPDRETDDRLQGRYADFGAPKLKATIKEGQNDLPAFDLR